MISPQTQRDLLPKKENYLAHLSVDCVIFGYDSGQLYVLITQLNTEGSIFTLPGGFVGVDEGVDTAALRVLQKRTGVEDIYLEQFRVFGEANRSRNPWMNNLVAEVSESLGVDVRDYRWLSERFVSIGYYALVNMEDVLPRKSPIDKDIAWYPISEIPALFLDHQEITMCALDALRTHLDRKLIGFNLLPEQFTMRDLQELYEAVYDQTYVRANFQKRMLRIGVLERLGKKYTGASNKAPYLYRFLDS